MCKNLPKTLKKKKLLDSPEISIEENWLQRDKGSWEVELACLVDSNPASQVV